MLNDDAIKAGVLSIRPRYNLTTLPEDIQAINAISRVREGKTLRYIEKCKAVFVTKNTVLVSATKNFLEEQEVDVGFPLELSKLCCSLTFSSNFELIYQIVGGEKFFEYAVNVSFNSLRHLIEQFISKDEETTDKIQALIDATENFNSKVILLRLLYRRITGDATQQKYKRILSDSFAQLPIGAIYDFAFSGWLTPNQDALKEFLNRILEISKKGNSSMRVFPDPVETKLECVYLLHISDMLADISMLKPLSEGRPHLQFLLNPKNFDYSQVDFSDYMWENFARREEYMKTFVAHKEVIIPKIQKRIETGEVTEAEKRILYGFLLRGDEVWKM